jgi:hypothetical protein
MVDMNTDLQAALISLAGVNLRMIAKTYSEVMQKDPVVARSLLKLAIQGAAGGGKAIKKSSLGPSPRDLNDTCFVLDNNYNFSAVTLLGHMVIASGAVPRATELFGNKYGAPNIWDLTRLNLPLPLKEDVRIKLETAKKHPLDPDAIRVIGNAITGLYGQKSSSAKRS